MELNMADLRIDVFHQRPQSAWFGGTDVAVRITHKPSGIFVEECSDRSIHRNKAEAMRKMEEVWNLAPELFSDPYKEVQAILAMQHEVCLLIADGHRYRKLKQLIALNADVEFRTNHFVPGEEVMLRYFKESDSLSTTHRGPNLDSVIDKIPVPK